MTTDTMPIARRNLGRGLAYSVGLVAVWLVAAALRPEVTYHLAPVLVAGALPVATVLDRNDPPGTTRALALAAGVGFAVAVVVAVLLAAVGRLDGPALGPFTSALAESIVGAAFGAGLGFGVAMLWRS